MTELWVRDLSGAKALVDDAGPWSMHGWTPTVEPSDRELVWMSHPDVAGCGLMPWGAREYWRGIGWSPSAPPEPYNPTLDPALTDAAARAAEEPPDGTVAQVAEWVGDDPARAAAALRAEQQRETPRTTLVDNLQRVGQGDATHTSAATAALNKEA